MPVDVALLLRVRFDSRHRGRPLAVPQNALPQVARYDFRAYPARAEKKFANAVDSAAQAS
jgi:hypothetical protein